MAEERTKLFHEAEQHASYLYPTGPISAYVDLSIAVDAINASGNWWTVSNVRYQGGIYCFTEPVNSGESNTVVANVVSNVVTGGIWEIDAGSGQNIDGYVVVTVSW